MFGQLDKLNEAREVWRYGRSNSIRVETQGSSPRLLLGYY
jgi:hypothetical protein